MSSDNHNVLGLPGEDYEEIYHNVPKAVIDAAKRRHPAYIGRQHLVECAADLTASAATVEPVVEPIPFPQSPRPKLAVITPKFA